MNPMLKTNRLEIRLYDNSDLERLFAYRKLKEINSYYSIKTDSIEEFDKYLKDNIKELGSPGYYSLYVIEKDGELIGDLAIKCWEYENKVGAIGYAIDPKHQRNGYATEALNALITYLFDVMKMHRIQAYVNPENIVSVKVLEKLGMKKEAHFRKCEYKNGKWNDELTYAVIEEDRNR